MEAFRRLTLLPKEKAAQKAKEAIQHDDAMIEASSPNQIRAILKEEKAKKAVYCVGNAHAPLGKLVYQEKKGKAK